MTQTGGHLGPVTFDRKGQRIRPFSIAPWAQEKIDPAFPTLLKALRGDFFCLPFGGNGTPFRGEKHPPHGETANAKWTLEWSDASSLHLSMRMMTRRGRVDKFITLPDDHDAVYQRHIVSGMSGPMSVGHHAMLKFPDYEAAGVVSSSGFKSAQVLPMPFEQPVNRGYSILKTGAPFTTLTRVPMMTGHTTDVARYPARRGFDDLVMLSDQRRGRLSDYAAWTAVTFPKEGFVWFALKDPNVLRNTILWLSNGGRHYPPWNGRHINVMGIEEVTSHFHIGLAESVKAGATIELNPRKPLTVNYIIAVAPIPRGFDRLASITRERGGVKLRSDSGRTVRVAVDIDFLHGT